MRRIEGSRQGCAAWRAWAIVRPTPYRPSDRGPAGRASPTSTATACDSDRASAAKATRLAAYNRLDDRQTARSAAPARRGLKRRGSLRGVPGLAVSVRNPIPSGRPARQRRIPPEPQKLRWQAARCSLSSPRRPPRAPGPGVGIELPATGLGERSWRLVAAGVAVVGVTCDNERQQTDWIAEHRWPHLLFSDERRLAVGATGYPAEREWKQRTTSSARSS